MITVITGLTGSGKTWLMTRILKKRRKAGDIIYANLSLNFPNDNEGVVRWHNLSETYNITNGVIAIDEGQKLFDAHLWPFLPLSFAEKIASHRHHFIDIFTTTQDFGHIDIRVRSNVHELYNCKSVFRWPKKESKKPILQYIKIIKKQRSFDDTVGIKWDKVGQSSHFISRLWTKELYNTYANIDLSHFICQIKRDKKKWLITLQSRQLANQRLTGHR
jgi:hypothetical protein